MRNVSRFSLALCVLLSPCWAGAVDAPQRNAPPLTWRIENPFRLFRNAADFEKLRIPDGVSIADWFSGIAYQIKGEYLPYRRTHWDPEGGVNTTGFYPSTYVFPKSHRIILKWDAAPADRCNWRIGVEQRRNVACAQATADIPFDYRNPQRVDVTVTEVVERGTVKTPISVGTSVLVRDRLVLALGDSYTAGQGSPDRPAELAFNDSVVIADPFVERPVHKANVWYPNFKPGPKEAQWWDNECNRSLLSWPVLASLKLASQFADQAEANYATEQDAVTLLSYACSGAEFYDGLFVLQKNPPGPSKVSAGSTGSALVGSTV